MKFEYSYLSRFPPSKWEVRFTIPGLCADVRTSSHRVRSAEECLTIQPAKKAKPVRAVVTNKWERFLLLKVMLL